MESDNNDIFRKAGANFIIVYPTIVFRLFNM